MKTKRNNTNSKSKQDNRSINESIQRRESDKLRIKEKRKSNENKNSDRDRVTWLLWRGRNRSYDDHLMKEWLREDDRKCDATPAKRLPEKIVQRNAEYIRRTLKTLG